MIVYGLMAKGPYPVFIGSADQKIQSKSLYRTIEAAEAAKEAFLDKCCDSTDNPFYMDREKIKITILEYNLED